MADEVFAFTFGVGFTGREIPEWAMQKVGSWRGQISAAELILAWEPAPPRPTREIFVELEGAIKEAAAAKLKRSAGQLEEPVVVVAADI